MIRALLGLLLASTALDALAWGDEGHEIVATIAYARLTPAAKKKVDALLAADKDTLTAKDFVSRATWADKYRDSDRNTTKVRYDATEQWHFTDIEIHTPDLDAACFNHPPVPSGTPASAGPAKDCAVDKINGFAAELDKPSTAQAEKILALKFLLHFVGDIHQPLHSADNHDRGGNEVHVVFGKHTAPSALHAYWDTELVQRMGKTPKTVGAALGKRITAAEAAKWAKGAPADWAKEAFDQAKSISYNFSGEKSVVDDHGGTAERLDAVYDKRALPVVREQLSKGGVRLAAVLNEALK
jgi:S1/P1 Nuclease